MTQSKNDSYRRARFDIIVEIANVLPLATLDALYSRIASLNAEDFDQVAIDMVKSFTEHALYIASVHAKQVPVCSSNRHCPFWTCDVVGCHCCLCFQRFVSVCHGV